MNKKNIFMLIIVVILYGAIFFFTAFTRLNIIMNDAYLTLRNTQNIEHLKVDLIENYNLKSLRNNQIENKEK